MKDAEFLELLNLYLDHEISPADAARLEKEVQTNPARRAVYRDYCRMQKACSVLATEFVEGADSGGTERSKVVDFSRAASARGRGAGVYWGAGAAAALAVAVSFGSWSLQRGKGDSAPVLAEAAAASPGVQVQTGAPALKVRENFVSMAAMPAGAGRVSLVASPLVLSGTLAGASLAGSGAVAPEGDELSWVGNLQIVSMRERNRAEILRFDPAPPSLRPEGRPLGVRPPADAALESAAFRFVK